MKGLFPSPTFLSLAHQFHVFKRTVAIVERRRQDREFVSKSNYQHRTTLIVASESSYSFASKRRSDKADKLELEL